MDCTGIYMPFFYVNTDAREKVFTCEGNTFSVAALSFP